MLLCKSAVDAFEQRNSVRETWKAFGLSHPVKVVFVLGLPQLHLTKKGMKLQEAVETESRQHEDILQEGFVDTYQNLTLKSMFSLKFANEYLLNRTDWVMLVDDDSYVNIPQLISFLDTVPKPRNDIIGKVYNFIVITMRCFQHLINV